MKAVICLLLLPSFIRCQFLEPPEVPFEFGKYRDNILKIFKEVSTLNILLPNHEQHGDVTKHFIEVFEIGRKSFVVFTFAGDESFAEWTEHCIAYQKIPSIRVAYDERFYKKSHGQLKIKRDLDFFEDFEPEMKSESDEYVDPQRKAGGATARELDEGFAEGLDNWFLTPKAGFVLFCSFDTIEHYLGCLLNRAGTFLFIIDGDTKNRTAENILEILKTAWNVRANLKVFVLIAEEILVLNPFEFDEVNGSFGTIEEASDKSFNRQLKSLNQYPMNIDLFYSAYSIPKFRNFSSKLTSYYGPDVEAACFIQEQMHVKSNQLVKLDESIPNSRSFIFQVTIIQNNGKFGGRLPNGTLSGALRLLQNGTTDIALTAFFLKDYETRACEFTYPLYMDELCVVVRKAARIPSELLPLMIFDELLWASLFFAGMMIGTAWSLIRFVNNVIRQPTSSFDRIKFYREAYNFSRFMSRQSQVRQFTQVYIDTWLLFLSIPMRRFTRIQNERIFISTVCLVGMIFVSMYQSGLATVFLRPLYFKDISSLQQLDASGSIIKVKYAGYLTDVFPNDSTDLFKSLHQKMKLAVTERSSMDLVTESKKVATITRKSTVLLDNSKYFMTKQVYLIDKECPKNYFLAYMVPTHSVYLERINEILMNIHRFGLIKKWINEINFQTTLLNMKSYGDSAATSSTRVLSLDDLKFPFFIWICGNSLGVALIAVELMIRLVKSSMEQLKKKS